MGSAAVLCQPLPWSSAAPLGLCSCPYGCLPFRGGLPVEPVQCSRSPESWLVAGGF